MRTGQAALEFLIVLTIALAAGVFLQLAQAQRTEAYRGEALRFEVEALAQGIALSLNQAGASRGFSASVDIPVRLRGEWVSVTVGTQNVVVSAGAATSSRTVRALNLRNATAGTPFTLAPGSYRAVNTDGTVTIS